MRRLLALCLCLSGCAAPTTPSGGRPSTREVLAWANLEERLGRQPSRLDYGKADGKALLGDKVMVLNGEEMVTFVRSHGYGSHDEAVAVATASPGLTRVRVPIRGRDGAEMVLLLEADGDDQGRG